MRTRFALLAAAAALLCVPGATATTPQATGIVVTAGFSNVLPTTAANVCGVPGHPTCPYGPPPVQVRWGTPVSGPQSGIGFAPTTVPAVNLNQNFVVGEITHFNFPIVNGASSVDLTVDLSATTADGPVAFHLVFPIGIDETTNQGAAADCTYQPVLTIPCPDALLLPGGTATETLAVGSTHQYSLSVLGFTASPTSTTPESHLVTQENQANNGYLVASLSRNNTPPAAANDSGSADSGGSTTIHVLANDTDADNDPLSVTSVSTPGHGTASINGDGTVTYTANADFAGNDSFTYDVSDGFATSTATVSVLVTDHTPPSYGSPSGNGPVEASGPDGAVVNYTETASDNVDSSPTVDCQPPAGSTFALGTTHVTCTATDAAGNTATTGFDVTVVDTTPPSLSGIPSDQTAEATTPGGAVVTYDLPTASDLVDPSPTVDCEPPSGSTLALGPHTITCTATDFSGNSTSQTFTVTVQDTTPPDLTVPDGVTAFSPLGGPVTVAYSASATDTVDPSPNVTCVPPSGSTFQVGTTTVTCTATDASRNTTEKQFDVVVIPNRPPVCSAVSASPGTLWSPNHKLVLVTLSGATDPDGNTLTYRIDGVTQDEALTGGGPAAPYDARLAGGGSVYLRAERAGTGDGRVYTIAFTVTDQYGLSCSGTVDVAVPHDQAHQAVKTPGVSVDSLG